MTSLSGKVYDCFIFFNEVDLLKVRLEEMYNYVDHFVLVESEETFRGKPKPSYYLENIEQFEKWADKIIYVFNSGHYESISPWPREAYQRNQIMKGLVDANDDDIILISDVDEIVRGCDVQRVIDSVMLHPKAVTGCIQPMYYFFFNRRFHGKDADWQGTQATTYRTLKLSNPETVRTTTSSYHVHNSGWHFSSIGYDNFIQKLKAFSHKEYDTASYLNNLDSLLINLEMVPIDDTFPKFIQENQDYFRHIKFIDESN